MNKKITSTGKKTNPVVIVVIALVVLAGLYYGAKRWRQQQYVNQLTKLYGGEAGLLGGLTGGNGGLSQKMIEELAKEAAKNEAQEKADEAKEAAKTPLDRFNETKTVDLTPTFSSMLKSTVEGPMTAVFGKIKPTLFSGNYMKQGDSFLVVYKVPRQPTSADMNKLVEEFAKDGYIDAMSTIEAEAANLLMEKDGNTLSIYYEDPSKQEVGILYVDQSIND
jgi:hypothetical protein